MMFDSEVGFSGTADRTSVPFGFHRSKMNDDFYARQHIYAIIARICHANSVCPSVRLSVCLSVCHTRVLYQNG